VHDLGSVGRIYRNVFGKIYTNVFINLKQRDVWIKHRETDSKMSVSSAVSKMTNKYNTLKVTVKFSLRFTKHHTMKAYWGSGGIAPRIL
jgi:hypothetical protein